MNSSIVTLSPGEKSLAADFDNPISFQDSPLQHQDSFFSHQFEQFLLTKYQSLYDCFFSIFKERQMKKNLASSQNSPAQSSMGDDSRSVGQQISQLTEVSLIYGFSGKAKAHKQLQKEAVKTYEDALYMPSGMSRNRNYSQFSKRNVTVEKDFKTLAKKLGYDFSVDLCKDSPYLESILKDIDSLNQIFRDQSILIANRTGRKEEHSNQANSPSKCDANQLTQIKLAIGLVGNDNNQLQAQRLEMRAKENEKLKERVKVLDDLTDKMRKNYYKDLLVYQNPSGKTWKQHGSLRNNSLAEEDQVHVEFFNALEGVDQEILDMINQRLFKVKEKCEKRIVQHIKYQEELLKKIYALNKLSPNAYGVVNLSLSEVIQSLRIVYPDPEYLWDEIHNQYGQDCFLVIIEREYGDRFAKDYTYLNSEIDKINQEAQFQIKEVQRNSQNEIQQLRKAIDEKNQEINMLKETQMREIEKAQKEAYANAEIQFKSIEAQAFVKYDQEKQELYQKIQNLETVNTDFDKIMTKQQLLFVITKLGLVAQLHKVLKRIKDSNGSFGTDPQVIQASIQRILDIIEGRTSQETSKIKQEYERDLKNMMDENNSLTVAFNEKKMIFEQQTDKITYLEQRLEDSYQEAQWYKGQVETMQEEHRRLEGEHSTLKRALENSKILAEGLEKEKNRLEFELQKIAGENINKYQSAYAEADLHRKKALNSITHAGTAILNTIYGHNSKTKGTQTYLKDVNSDLEMTKKNQDGTMTKVQNQLFKLNVNASCQTDTDVIVLTKEEYNHLPKKHSSKSPISLNNGLDQIEERDDQSVSQSSINQIKEGCSNQGIQCELLNPSKGKTTYDYSAMIGGMSNSEWKTRQSAEFERIQTAEHYLAMYEKQKASLYTNLLSIENNMPDVYKRLWMNVFERAAKNQRIRNEFDKIRKEQFDKVQAQVNAQTHPQIKGKNIFHKDSITGKVFINLVELYKNTQFFMFEKQSRTNFGQRNEGAKLDYSFNIEDSSKVNEVPQESRSQFVDCSTQTDEQMKQESIYMNKRILLQSRGLSRNAVIDNSISNQNSYGDIGSVRDRLKTSKTSFGHSIMKTQNEFYNKSKWQYLKHSLKKQREYLDQSLNGKNSTMSEDRATQRKLSKKLKLDQQNSIFEIPAFVNNSYLNIKDENSPRMNAFKSDGKPTHSKKSSIGAFILQSRDSSRPIFLKQPLVKINKTSNDKQTLK